MKKIFSKTKSEIGAFYYRRPKTSYYFAYSTAFLLLATLVFSFFMTAGKSFIWVGSADGISQHFNSLAYFGTYLRDILANFVQGDFAIPMWDFSIGYGADIMTTLHYYAIGDPLNLLSVFFKPEQTEVLYCGLVIVRLYLSGLAFSAFSRKMKRSNYGTFLGAIIYAFCGFALYASVRHPYFINSMIYLPLLLLGVEKIFKKERPYLFIAMVFVSVVSNFYFFYVLSVLTVLYIAFRFFMIYKERIVKNLAMNFVKFGGFYLVGFAMGCFIFLPVAMLTVSSNRATADTALHAVYEWDFYTNFVAAFVGGNWNSNWTCLSFAPIALTGVFLLFSQKKKNTYLKIMFIVLTVFAMLPIMGKVLNGFSYVTNRWIFAYALFIAFIVATVSPVVKKLTKRNIAVLTLSTVAYLLFVMFVPPERKVSGDFSYLILFAVSTVFVATYILQNHSKKIKKSTVLGVARFALIALTATGIVANAYARYSPKYGNYIDEFMDMGESYSVLTDTETSAIKELYNSQFFRYEIDNNDLSMKYNSAIQNKTFGSDYYFSLVDSNVSDYMQSMRFVRNNDATYSGFDRRAYLSTFASSKYFVSETANALIRPFGYNKMVSEKYSKTNDKTFYVYENENALPFGFTYSSFISQSDFDKMTVTEKQQALLQGAVGEFGNLVGETTLHFTDKEIGYSIENMSEDVEINDGKIVVSKKNSEIALEFNSLPNSETYVVLDNLVFDDGGKGGSFGTITAIESGEEHDIRVNTPEYSWYTGNHDFLSNLGYSDGSKTSLVLKFKQKGTYTFDSMKIISQPMNELKNQSDKLKESSMTDVSFDTNRVTGKVAVDSSKVLAMTVPFNNGWTAYVDGEKTELKMCGVMFSGVELEAGEHTVELRYKTPYQNTALVLTALGLVSAAGIMVFYEKQRKKIKNS